MAENSKIEWCDHTFNPWWGCQKAGPGCDNCYAESLAKRTGKNCFGPGKERIRTSPVNWKLPLKWNRQAEKNGVRYKVFCASMADVFDNAVPDEWRQDLFDLILKTPNLDWLLLTKRIGNVKKMLDSVATRRSALLTVNDEYRPPKNVWLGITVCNQPETDRDIPKLLKVPAEKRFVSIEPMLSAVDLEKVGGNGRYTDSLIGTYVDGHACKMVATEKLDWVILGGESGRHARPVHPDWVRSIRDQCAAAGVPFVFKQWGEWVPGEDAACGINACYELSKTGGWVEPSGEYSFGEKANPKNSGAVHVFRVGKKAAGRLLDGREHMEFPEVKHG